MYSTAGGLIPTYSGRNTDAFYFAGYSGGFMTKYQYWISGGNNWN